MKREEATDFFVVYPQHLAIHRRLQDWSRYMMTGRGGRNVHPMWIKTPRAEGWTYDELPIPLNMKECADLEKAVVGLPDKHRTAIRWAYVPGWRPAALLRVKARYLDPGHIQRHLAVTRTGLMELIHDGRSMLKNRA